jgi:hypothetical protein
MTDLRDLARYVALCVLDAVLIAVGFAISLDLAHTADARVPDLNFWALLALATPTATLIRAVKEGRW